MFWSSKNMKALLTALVALAFAAPALAAPPPNDNRADAQLLPSFPASTHGTTVDATVERLDPQVSKCGRIEATVWYRIEAAPDGTIVATVQASGTLAPVVRIYRRNPSNIAEVSTPCPFRRCRVARISFGLSCSDSLPLIILRELEAMEVPI